MKSGLERGRTIEAKHDPEVTYIRLKRNRSNAIARYQRIAYLQADLDKLIKDLTEAHDLGYNDREIVLRKSRMYLAALIDNEIEWAEELYQDFIDEGYPISILDEVAKLELTIWQKSDKHYIRGH